MPCVRVRWSDWQLPEPARFDLQEMLDFCQTMPDGWSVRIFNATGRVGGQVPAGAGSVAEVEFCFPDQPDLDAFQQRFGAILAATPGPPAQPAVDAAQVRPRAAKRRSEEEA